MSSSVSASVIPSVVVIGRSRNIRTARMQGLVYSNLAKRPLISCHAPSKQASDVLQRMDKLMSARSVPIIAMRQQAWRASTRTPLVPGVCCLQDINRVKSRLEKYIKIESGSGTALRAVAGQAHKANFRLNFGRLLHASIHSICFVWSVHSPALTANNFRTTKQLLTSRNLYR